MHSFAELKKELSNYLNENQIEEVRQAYLVAEHAHQGQFRKTGEPYIEHPLAVSLILAKMRLDHQSIMAGLLHDVVEDTSVDKEFLGRKFGQTVAELVDGVSKLDRLPLENQAQMRAENLRKMILAMVKDIRVVIIKMADRLHNMRTLVSLPWEKRRRIARETMEIYAPIANRLGMNKFKVEFEDLGFSILHPWRAKVLKTEVDRVYGQHLSMMQQIADELRQRLISGHLKNAAVFGRQKHLYSIYRKMKNKHISFNELSDVFAFRVEVDEIDECYRVLGMVHNLYKPVPERFKDYIAIPKQNGYQALHTSLFGPHGIPIEIQIRTREMGKIAESGVAAHWLYKTSEIDALNLNSAQMRAQEWFHSLEELQQQAGSSVEFLEGVKFDLFPDEVYVFTPRGDIVKLPHRATIVDFAYAVHTDIGSTCVAAKIDRKLAPLSSRLKSGQTVEIICLETARPSAAWLDFVVTGKARSNIRHFLRLQQQVDAENLGKRLLDSVLKRQGLALDNLPDEVSKIFLAEAQLKSLHNLYAEIGLGNRSVNLVALRLLGLVEELSQQRNGLELSSSAEQAGSSLAIKGSEGMAVKFASCCWPIPGDPILGFMVSGRGIEVHTEQCHSIVKYLNRLKDAVPLHWEDKIDNNFKVCILVPMRDQKGMLARLAMAIFDMDVNIEHIDTIEQDGAQVVVKIIINVKNRVHLAQVIRRLRAIKNVGKIVRCNFKLK